MTLPPSSRFRWNDNDESAEYERMLDYADYLRDEQRDREMEQRETEREKNNETKPT
jgi:hypothetical protein